METLTLRDAAQLTGCSPSVLLDHIKSGRLAATRSAREGRLELRVARGDLARAGLLPRDAEAEPQPDASGEGESSRPLVPRGDLAPLARSEDLVPGLLYRELLMKHEQLLVQYGMVRVGGARLFEYKAEAERTRDKLEETRRALEGLEQRRHREIAELQAGLRRAELRLQERDQEIVGLRSRLRALELETRNAATAESVERQFLEVMDRARPGEGFMGGPEGPPRRPKRPPDH